MPSLFGTDGVRGVANQEPMTPETVVKLGRAVAHLFKAPGARRSIVIGKDTRLTGYMLETALTAGIANVALSLAEDIVAFLQSLVSIFLPLVALVVVIAIGLIFILTIPRMARFLDLFGRRRPSREAPPPL